MILAIPLCNQRQIVIIGEISRQNNIPSKPCHLISGEISIHRFFLLMLILNFKKWFVWRAYKTGIASNSWPNHNKIELRTNPVWIDLKNTNTNKNILLCSLLELSWPWFDLNIITWMLYVQFPIFNVMDGSLK